MDRARVSERMTREQELDMARGRVRLSVTREPLAGYYRCESLRGAVGVAVTPRRAIELCRAVEAQTQRR